MAFSINPSEEQEILEKINRIVLLRLKALIAKRLKKGDMPEFEQIIKSNNSSLLLNFASKKIPNFSKLVYQEIENITRQMNLSV